MSPAQQRFAILRVVDLHSEEELDDYGRQVSLSNMPEKIRKLVYKAIELKRSTMATNKERGDCRVVSSTVRPGELK